MLTRSFTILVMALLLPASAWPQTRAQRVRDLTAGLPLAQGSYWLYEGEVRWTPANSSEAVAKKVIWKMEVTETIQRGQLTAAVLKGLPSDLAWYREGRQPSEQVIIKVGASKYYRIKDEEAEILRMFRDQQTSPAALIESLHEGDLFLKLPLMAGMSFGQDEDCPRGIEDGMYCWTIVGQSRVNLRGIRGVKNRRKVTEYSLAFRTTPDHQFLKFVPGIGITSYEYAHHGTVSGVDLKLIEFYVSTRSRNPAQSHGK